MIGVLISGEGFRGVLISGGLNRRILLYTKRPHFRVFERFPLNIQRFHYFSRL